MNSMAAAIFVRMSRATATHRTTVDIELEPFERARKVLGTTGYKETINEALRHVERSERLRRGARAILAQEHDLTSPEELQDLRRPRV